MFDWVTAHITDVEDADGLGDVTIRNSGVMDPEEGGWGIEQMSLA